MREPKKWATRHLAAFVLVLATSSLAQGVEASSAWTRLQRLAGTWQATSPQGTVITAVFRPTSRGSALVETYTAGQTETLTIFHPAGRELLATHYCAQGNQPRLRLVEKDSSLKTLVFELRDVTNLTTPDDPHLTRLTLELAEPQRLIVTETYLESGKPDATTLAFTRR